MESFAYLIFAVIATVYCCSGLAIPVLIAGVVVLLLGTRRGQEAKPLWTASGLALILITALWLAGVSYPCSLVETVTSTRASQSATTTAAYTPEYFNWHNPEMHPFIRALDAVDRDALGFTPIPAYARVEVERQCPGGRYHVLLHIYAETSRTVAFRRVGEEYVWVGEQEIHTGPALCLSPTAYENETIAVTYDTVYISGAPLNTIYIDYIGTDPRLAGRYDLTLDDIQPVLEEWYTRQSPPSRSPAAVD